MEEDLPGVLCGYHLGRARPLPGRVDGAFLAASLHTSRARQHFARIANGVTRFGLTLGATRGFPVPLPPMSEQRRIATVLESVDRTITTTSADLATTSSLYDAVSSHLLTPNASDIAPGGWRTLPVSSVITPLRFDRAKQIPKHLYASDGQWPVYDQSPAAPAAFTNDSDRLISRSGPVIIFGDHTKTFRYVTPPFALGAEGTKPLVVHPAFYPQFVFHALRRLRIPGRGYNRYYSVLRDQRLLVPTRRVQERVARILDAALDARSALCTLTRRTDALYRCLLNRIIFR